MKFMRGRIVAGTNRQMGIADAPTAPLVEDYAPLALALGRDPGLFADMKAVREFETFPEAAVAAATNGQNLPSGW